MEFESYKVADWVEKMCQKAGFFFARPTPHGQLGPLFRRLSLVEPIGIKGEDTAPHLPQKLSENFKIS